MHIMFRSLPQPLGGHTSALTAVGRAQNRTIANKRHRSALKELVRGVELIEELLADAVGCPLIDVLGRDVRWVASSNKLDLVFDVIRNFRLARQIPHLGNRLCLHSAGMR